MREAPTSQTMTTGILRVKEIARRDPNRQMLALGHHLDPAALGRAYDRLRGSAAVGVDGITKEDYGRNLEANIADLHRRMVEGRYRHQAIRRVNIPKENGQQRPIGVSSTEDKVVQGALRELLEAVYEPMFIAGSYGFRPHRGAHDALRALDQGIGKGVIQYVIEADIVSFFDSLDRRRLRELLAQRIADKSFLRLVGKCLRAGVLDGATYEEPGSGTPQGSSLSPVLGNIYLHHALDAWFEQEVKPTLRGRAQLIRYADDFIIGVEQAGDAEQIMRALPVRLAEYGLQLHATKTRQLDFRRPPPGQRGGPAPDTFDFLGFTVYWKRSGRGRWHAAYKTRGSRLRRSVHRLRELCRAQRHDPLEEQYRAIMQRVVGHLNYFAVEDNQRCVAVVINEAKRAWMKWLGRRSQRARMTWAKFERILERFPMPHAGVRVRLWASAT